MNSQSKVTLPLPSIAFKAKTSKSWHDSESDFHLRKGMIYIMMELLQSIKEEQLARAKFKLVKHIELNLYIIASSMEEYADMSTLRQRMVKKVKKMALFDNPKKSI